jgi:hypothetical protein
VVNGDHLQGMMVWIQEDTDRDYSQTEYGKNTLVVGDKGDRENSPAMLIEEGGKDDDVRGKILWI